MAHPPHVVEPCDVLGVGANSVDRVLRLAAAPEPSGPRSKLRILDERERCGGQVATAMATCARLGLRSRYLGTVGTDNPGRRLIQELASSGVDVTPVVVREGRNPFAVILIDETTGERIVLWHREDGVALHRSMIGDDLVRAARLVHVDDVDADASIAAAEMARSIGLPVTSDVDHADEWTEKLVAAVSHPIFSEEGLSAFANESDPERALRRLRHLHPGLLTVTLGAEGAMALDQDVLIRVPACPVAAVDTTGAGDVFRGAFIYGVLQRWPVVELLQFATAAAGVACTRRGALKGAPDLAEVRALLSPERSTP
jgi:sulfofructose kinase